MERAWIEMDSVKDDSYRLQRFVEAQQAVYDTALAELRNGCKRTHWMWFIFPQIDGLGSSQTASHYAIRTLGEAKAYLRHPVLGPRLKECTNILLGLQGLSVSDVFGYPDDLKFCSSMTLFEFVAPEDAPFRKAIHKYCAGQRDELTLAILKLAKT
jgi:uncharacterized protein (DUF1810 family)